MEPNKMFELYMEHSYRYYELDEPVITDYEYDALCARLLPVFDKVDHPDKGLTDEDALRAGTGFQMYRKYPQWVKDLVQ